VSLAELNGDAREAQAELLRELTQAIAQ